MLNKIKKNLLSMLDTLGEALAQYISMPSEELRGGIIEFIDAINGPLACECKGEDAVVLSRQLKAALENPALPEIERLYSRYCGAIDTLPVQYKAVFLPYYDNTWDSLKSVYEAFVADPMFVTEIVIIPIRRNTPSGWKIIYQDYLTPVGIPNTRFSDYSFKKDLPDFVFYNNPYNDVNIEKFQSQNIKPYAGCMVYIPYFLYLHTFQNKPELQYEADQYTQLSGHDNSDIFVVQGNSFLRTFAHRSRNGGKMVALGNPKVDNIYKHKQSYPRYPEWDKATEGKTVFLLNTHYLSAVDGSYKDFLPDLLEFIELNDDLALIWRPHPQSFLMFDEGDQSANYIDWRNCLDRVNAHERMILDRTASNISAIMYSDAVLSTMSSVVIESLAADKPVFVWAFDPREDMSSDVLATITFEDYIKKLEQLRKYDAKNLFLLSVVRHIGPEHIFENLKTGSDDLKKERMRIPMFEFIEEIRNGLDGKKELRALFCEQMFANRGGACGENILNYIVNMVKT